MITVKGNKNIVKAAKEAAVIAVPVKPTVVKVEAMKVLIPEIVGNPEPITIEVKDVRGNVLGTLKADYRTFSSGNKGYWMSGKIPGQGADRLQVSGSVVIIGSKNH